MDRPKLPKLPYGHGVYGYVKDTDKIEFKKRVKMNDGTIKRVTVVGSSIRECDELLAQKVDNLNKNILSPTKQTLVDGMNIWLHKVKKDTLKEQSYNRLASTIRNQIATSDIAKYAYDVITTDLLQSLIDDLNYKKYSKSVIKKTFDALNDFYRYSHNKYGIKNPMALVKMPIMNNIKAETKKIEFFEKEDIDLFIAEADVKWNTGTIRYPQGYALAANIYMGMRIGELLALRWEDVDFDKNTVYICKTVIESKNPEYDEDDPERMNSLGISKMICTIQKSTKMSKNRYVPMNSRAKELMQKQYEIAQYKEPEDLVICSRNKQLKSIKNVSDTILRMQKNAGTTVQSGSTHILRHTCASLYFRKGVPIETICQILGNTREVCEKTYIHFIEEQLQEAASKITAIEV